MVGGGGGFGLGTFPLKEPLKVSIKGGREESVDLKKKFSTQGVR